MFVFGISNTIEMLGYYIMDLQNCRMSIIAMCAYAFTWMLTLLALNNITLLYHTIHGTPNSMRLCCSFGLFVSFDIRGKGSDEMGRESYFLQKE